ncbi:ABC transporter ATP-binding protein [Conexibacter sp. CPCC 206217]|uniref:ABC transporter ATP-binding protein n=1 Tax=Conexibacter sp. CPCC 206217 TaxID=3064574 RepID=UPI00271ABBDD|nr:ABC transporter ATP-binding protein [Conexibacter sp. CPCC 206217]MDO8210171.1 ABC transporter ATP-binding protein [Conexibacter sp. CPCC 206217]
MTASPAAGLAVEHLRVEGDEGVAIVEDLSFEVMPGELMALVGESGCGKTSVGMSLLGHARRGTRIAGGQVVIGGRDILAMSRRQRRDARGRLVSYVPQDPSTGLGPRRRIIRQMVESAVVHGVATDEARRRAMELLARVHLPESVADRYPFELSGGQQQRVLIAMALMCEPQVVVFDEPTTGLDVSTQARIIELIRELLRAAASSFVYITHDLAVVDALADRVAVMYSGAIVEVGDAREVFSAPSHPYSRLLLDSTPSVRTRRRLAGIPGAAAQPDERPSGCSFRARCPLAVERCAVESPPPLPAHGGGSVRCHRPSELRTSVGLQQAEHPPRDGLAVLEVEGLRAGFGSGSGYVEVVHDVSFTVRAGECIALVGGSGSGKTTTGRCVVGLHAAQSGVIRLEGEQVASELRRRTAGQLARLQMIVQNPDRSLNPSKTVRQSIERPLVLRDEPGTAAERAGRVRELLEQVRISARTLDRYPAELSGGEKQRVAIARALASEPRVLLCDEVTSALDVSVQAAVLDVLDVLRAQGIAMVFITHDLGVVRSLSDRVLVMSAGHVVEQGTTSEVIEAPRHAYSRELLAAAVEIGERPDGRSRRPGERAVGERTDPADRALRAP